MHFFERLNVRSMRTIPLFLNTMSACGPPSFSEIKLYQDPILPAVTILRISLAMESELCARMQILAQL